jgi:hypothetical protein
VGCDTERRRSMVRRHCRHPLRLSLNSGKPPHRSLRISLRRGGLCLHTKGQTGRFPPIKGERQRGCRARTAVILNGDEVWCGGTVDTLSASPLKGEKRATPLRISLRHGGLCLHTKGQAGRFPPIKGERQRGCW